MTRVIAVTGVTGALGSRVADRVVAGAAAADATVRLVVRDAARAPRLPGAAITEFPGGYAEGESFRDALAGVHTLYLVSAAEAQDRLTQHLTAVEAAAAAGVQRIVYTSFVGADRPDPTFTLLRPHGAPRRARPAPWRDRAGHRGHRNPAHVPPAQHVRRLRAVLRDAGGRPGRHRRAGRG